MKFTRILVPWANRLFGVVWAASILALLVWASTEFRGVGP